MKPRLLDLYAGAGGAARGYQLAGFHVTGVDIKPQPRYAGDEFVQADALEYAATHARGFDAIHASPPCRDHSMLAARSGKDGTGVLLAATRDALDGLGLPYVIENVPGAPMRPDVLLCGEMFDLGVRRHRWFETNPVLYSLIPPCRHDQRVVSVHGRPGGRSTRDGIMPNLADWKAAMGIDWMTARELSQAIPPPYTRWLGQQLLAHLATAIPSTTRE